MNNIYILIKNKLPLSKYEEAFILENFSNIIFVNMDDIEFYKNEYSYLKRVFKRKVNLINKNEFDKLTNISILDNDVLKFVEYYENFRLANSFVINKVVYSNNLNNYISDDKLIINSGIIKRGLFKRIKFKYVDKNRFKHALNVGYLSYKIGLFQNKNINLESLFLCGIIHDIAKDLNKEKLDLLSKKNKYFIESKDYVLHQFAGAIIYSNLVKKIDNDIYSSISFHCTGKKNMNLFEKIIFYADKYDPLRYINKIDKIPIITRSIQNSYFNFDKNFKEFIDDQISYFKMKKYDYLDNKYSKEFYDYETQK